MRWTRRIRGRLRRRGPSPETLDRIEAAVRAETRRLYGEASPQPQPVRRRPRRRTALLAGAGALVGVTAVAGAALVMQAGDEPTVAVSPVGRAGLAESPHLRDAPWLFQRQGSRHILDVRPLAAIEFPPGTTYRVALHRLLTSVVETGTLPAGVKVVRPPHRTVVWHAGTRARGPRLSLTAPWGYTVPGGGIRTPTYSIPGDVPMEEVLRIGALVRRGLPAGIGSAHGLQVDVPALARCQVLRPGQAHRRCVVRPPARAGTPG